MTPEPDQVRRCPDCNYPMVETNRPSNDPEYDGYECRSSLCNLPFDCPVCKNKRHWSHEASNIDEDFSLTSVCDFCENPESQVKVDAEKITHNASQSFAKVETQKFGVKWEEGLIAEFEKFMCEITPEIDKTSIHLLATTIPSMVLHRVRFYDSIGIIRPNLFSIVIGDSGALKTPLIRKSRDIANAFKKMKKTSKFTPAVFRLLGSQWSLECPTVTYNDRKQIRSYDAD